MPSEATNVPSLTSSTSQISSNRDNANVSHLSHVVHRVVVAQHPVVRQRVCHHRRVERVVREVLHRGLSLQR